MGTGVMVGVGEGSEAKRRPVLIGWVLDLEVALSNAGVCAVLLSRLVSAASLRATGRLDAEDDINGRFQDVAAMAKGEGEGDGESEGEGNDERKGLD
ncbi:hypothetical protein CKAH01_05798 [Colletotrichum kahawae]|uniref:Uncharacterized protein n=1 Tax=Colletotrichum kahawae TaxID=34407 RepID=A0AAD9YEU8_COLKA|nr:hypothetical protein CKAH01_05798 [Colletotrichum kahawae]